MIFLEPIVMGIVNCTPDSFYAASRSNSPLQTVQKIRNALEEGAEIIDIGGCSTRPGADIPSCEEEWARLEPSLKAISEFFPGLRLSIDTFRPQIVERAYRITGPFWVNDITAGSFDKEMVPLVAQLGLPWIAMHQVSYEGPAGVKRFFQEKYEEAEKAGIKDLVLDPGFGFNKTMEQHYELMEHLPEIVPVNNGGEPVAPLLVGISRKRMTYLPLGLTPDHALLSTTALHLHLLYKGAGILRVHDVAPAVQMVRLYKKLRTFVKSTS